MNHENTILGLAVGLLGSVVMTTLFAFAYANAPIKGCDNLDELTPANVVTFCESFTTNK